MAEPVLSCRSLNKTYRTSAGPVTAISEITLDILPGEMTAIIGPSGSGKTPPLGQRQAPPRRRAGCLGPTAQGRILGRGRPPGAPLLRPQRLPPRRGGL